MSDYVFPEKQVKTRKEHKCFTCLDLFPKGSIMHIHTCVNDGDFYSYYTCEDCEYLIDNYWSFISDNECNIAHGCIYDNVLDYNETAKSFVDLLMLKLDGKRFVEERVFGSWDEKEKIDKLRRGLPVIVEEYPFKKDKKSFIDLVIVLCVLYVLFWTCFIFS